MKCILPHTPLLYSTTGVCRGYTYFLIFAPKHRLLVLIHVPTIYVLSKTKKNINNFLLKFLVFTAEKISVYCMDKYSCLFSR